MEEEPSITDVEKGENLTKKQELNNHVVVMRKYVQQARVHTINKLAKEVKKLKERKGDEASVKKSHRKAERLLEEISVLKHIKKDDASIFALQDKKTLQEYLQHVETSIQSKAIARLSHHPSVQTEVKKYRDKNPHWALQIPVLLEKSKEKQKKCVKKAERKEKLKSERENQVSGNSTTQGQTSDECKSTVSQVPKSKTSTKKVKQETKLDKVEGTIKVQVLKDLTDLEEPELDTRKRKSPSTVEGTLSQKRPRSSFFVGGVDEPVTIKKETKKPEKLFPLPKGRYSEPKPVFRKGKLISRPRVERRSEQVDQRRHFDKSSNEGIKFASKKKFNEPISKIESAITPTEKLHPSWEAKKRQAQVLKSFQGKKTVFENDD